MSTFNKIKVANFFARQSCAAWQPIRIVRVICRHIYRYIMEHGAKEYPYANPKFADWQESDGNFYTLVTDSSGFVIRRSTSYVACLMKKHCWSSPKLPKPGPRKPGEHRFDAKHWGEILEYNGWQKVSKADWPSYHDIRIGRHFIGIIADADEFGLLVWFKNAGFDLTSRYETWIVSTYKDFKEQSLEISSEKSSIIWYCEPKVKDTYL